MWKDCVDLKQLPALGDKALDDEHRAVAAFLTALHDAILTRKSLSDQRMILYETLSYLRVNCTHEEELMQHDKYPNATVHREAHERLHKALRWLDEILITAPASAQAALQDFTVDLLEHINHDDRLIVVWHRQCTECNQGV
jgi:hemerythrin-like metal-binding protein